MIVRNRLPQIIVGLPRVTDVSLRAGAEVVSRAAKERVPVDEGDLRDAIHVEKADGGWAVVAGDRGAFYGHFIEFGTVNRGPRPFLVPALEQSKGEIVATVAASLRKL